MARRNVREIVGIKAAIMHERERLDRIPSTVEHSLDLVSCKKSQVCEIEQPFAIVRKTATCDLVEKPQVARVRNRCHNGSAGCEQRPHACEQGPRIVEMFQDIGKKHDVDRRIVDAFTGKIDRFDAPFDHPVDPCGRARSRRCNRLNPDDRRVRPASLDLRTDGAAGASDVEDDARLRGNHVDQVASIVFVVLTVLTRPGKAVGHTARFYHVPHAGFSPSGAPVRDVASQNKTHRHATSSLERRGLSDEQLVGMLRTMLMQRTLESRGFALNRQGKIPFASASEGHEAVQAGAAMAFERGTDILVPYYRDLGLDLGIGLTPYEVLLSLFGRAADLSAGRQFPHHYASKRLGLHSISSIIAAQLPHAVGAAYAIAQRAERRAVLVTFGDGSTSEGEWHESLNFAAVHRLPIVFLCENNEWAISTPLSKQMAQPDIAKRAAGYGMPGVIVDGMDPIAAYHATREALTRARDGGGPTLVEAKCYRFLSHTTDDD